MTPSQIVSFNTASITSSSDAIRDAFTICHPNAPGPDVAASCTAATSDSPMSPWSRFTSQAARLPVDSADEESEPQ